MPKWHLSDSLLLNPITSLQFCLPIISWSCSIFSQSCSSCRFFSSSLRVIWFLSCGHTPHLIHLQIQMAVPPTQSQVQPVPTTSTVITILAKLLLLLVWVMADQPSPVASLFPSLSAHPLSTRPVYFQHSWLSDPVKICEITSHLCSVSLTAPDFALALFIWTTFCNTVVPQYLPRGLVPGSSLDTKFWG